MPRLSRPGLKMLLLAALGAGLAGCVADSGPVYPGGYYSRPPAYGYGPGYGGWYGSGPPAYAVPHRRYAPPPRYYGSPHRNDWPRHVEPRRHYDPPRYSGPPPSRGRMPTIPEAMREGYRR